MTKAGEAYVRAGCAISNKLPGRTARPSGKDRFKPFRRYRSLIARLFAEAAFWRDLPPFLLTSLGSSRLLVSKWELAIQAGEAQSFYGISFDDNIKFNEWTCQPGKRGVVTDYKFTVDAELLRELGERLVGRPHIALAELIKNSYDADATKVEIGF